MARDSRYDVLFEPLKISPVTSRNCFFQGPHCNGMGTQYPRTQAAMRETNESLYGELAADQAALDSASISSVTPVGDCVAPSTIAAAVFEGHRYARELDEPAPADVPFLRDRIAL